MKVHCLFEQSGTFKNEFKKLGFECEDYDILNDFGETDNVVDLFQEIRGGYNNEKSIFDNISKDDLVLAFFPCTRFENQILITFRGESSIQKKWSLQRKLETDLEKHKELAEYYSLITKLVLIALKKGFKLIIENPYSTQHYLHRYWCIRPKVIHNDRTLRGDYYTKPTQFFFINCEPKYNWVNEPIVYQKEYKTIYSVSSFSHKGKVERSMISKEYANRFIKEYIL